MRPRKQKQNKSEGTVRMLEHVDADEDLYESKAVILRKYKASYENAICHVQGRELFVHGRL